MAYMAVSALVVDDTSIRALEISGALKRVSVARIHVYLANI